MGMVMICRLGVFGIWKLRTSSARWETRSFSRVR